MALVYRLEAYFGTPYCVEWDEIEDENDKYHRELHELNTDLLSAHMCNPERPSAPHEFKKAFCDEMYCGCSTLEKLKEWFTTPEKCFFDEFMNMGFEVAVYEVPDAYVREGELQCIFPMDSAKFMGSYYLNDDDEMIYEAN